MQDVAVSGSSIRCSFCHCVFCSQLDLDLHLKAFGSVPHLRLWHCVHILLEIDGCNTGVDDHGEWHWSERDFAHPNTVRACRELLSNLAERSEATRSNRG